jgi:hypothetical protein
MFLDSYMRLFIQGFVEKTSRQRTGRSPGPTEEANAQRGLKTLILRENVSFSTIVF